MDLKPGDLVKPVRRRGGAVERVVGITDDSESGTTVWLSQIGSHSATGLSMDVLDTYWVKVGKPEWPS